MEALVRTLMEELKVRLARPRVARDKGVIGIPGKIDVAIGMRRSGKTFTLFQEIGLLIESGVPREAVLYVNFEDDRLAPLDLEKAAALVDAFYALFPENHHRRCYLFLDEVHVFDGWSRLVRRLHDTKDARIYVTGSSARLLGKEVATELRGRSVATEIWPYSLAEFVRALGDPAPDPLFGRPTMDHLVSRLRRYLREGGFPEVLELDPWQRRRILQDYVDVVVFRDVVERHGITNIPVARYLTRTLLRSAGRSFSVHKTYNDLKSQGRRLSKDTLYEYLAYFEDAFLCFAVPLHEASPRKSETAPKKIYAVDPGLSAAVTPDADRDWGHLFENVVYLDLRRAGREVWYYRTAGRREVDFVARGPDGATELIQVCYDPSEAATLARERRALVEAEAELGLPGRMITPERYLRETFAPEAAGPAQ